MLFVEGGEDIVNGLQRDVEEIKKGDSELIPHLVEKAFLRAVIPNAGFLGFSSIRSGVTDDIGEKFEWLYKRYVDARGEKPKEERPPARKKVCVCFECRIIRMLRSRLRQRALLPTLRTVISWQGGRS
jgi:hypothetical protein